MMRINKEQVFHFLDRGGPDHDFQSFLKEWCTYEEGACPLGEEDFNALKAADLVNILVGAEMSESHLGGPDLISIADDVAAATEKGYKIYTWYGGGAEALVFGLKSDTIVIRG